MNETMNNQNQVPKKSWQEKQQERELELNSLRRRNVAKTISFWTFTFVAIFALGWWYITGATPKGPDLSESVLILDRNHIANGTVIHSYNSNPPTSGSHYAEPANTGFYSNELPDERVVHNLEHGNIWIAYRPSLPEEVLKEIKRFAGGNVIATPRPKNDTDVALAAWGRLDKFDLENGVVQSQRIKDFILRYQNRGPESISTTSH